MKSFIGFPSITLTLSPRVASRAIFLFFVYVIERFLTSLDSARLPPVA